MANDNNKFDANKVLGENSKDVVTSELARLKTPQSNSEGPVINKTATSQLSQLTSVGAIDTAIGDQFFGINHRQTPGIVPINKDVHGYTFFTRPRLNLSSANVRNLRQLTPLLTTDPNSYPRIIRNTLDHTLEASGLPCQFVDPQQVFIPFLMNNLITINGWPDRSVTSHLAQEGVYKETFGWVDGPVEYNGAYTLTATFRNIPGDPVNALFDAWLFYMSNVFDGTLVPYFDNIVENEIDYQTRIWRLVMDATKTKVQKIGCCGAAWPLNNSLGAAFNFDHSTPFNQSNSEIPINFQAVGFMAQDPILIYEFNVTVQQLNDNMSDEKREQYHVKVPPYYLQILNNRGYPRINPDTYELEWWVSKQLYNERTSGSSL